MVSSKLLQEPYLYFADEGKSISPQAGLLKYGPIGIDSENVTTISLGLVSSRDDKNIFLQFNKRITDNVAANFENGSRKIEFPGLGAKSPLRFQFELVENNWSEVSISEIKRLLKIPEKVDRVVSFYNLLMEKIDEIISVENPTIDVLVIVIPQKLLEKLKTERMLTDRIYTKARSFSLSYDENVPPFFDFHHAIKAYCMSRGKPSQLLLPKTIRFQSKQDFSSLAWNFSVAMYYKGTDTPWKLTELVSKTCYVGISFYQEITEEFRGMNTAMAQVFMRNGESQVIRGKPFHWDPNISKSPELTADQAEEILSAVVKLYERSEGRIERIVIHKTSRFTEDEIEGFDRITDHTKNGGDYLHIISKNSLRSLPRTNYPPLRGMTFGMDEGKLSQQFVYTSGFVPALNTYYGSRVPMPLQITSYRQDSENQTLLDEIMALTKLDWNNTNFNSRLPVTISVSRKVGEILAELRQINAKPLESYRYYM